MQFTVLQNNLHNGLNIVSRAVNPRAAMPILSNILLKADKGQLKLTASDLQITISAWVGAKVDSSGEITVPARLLIDFVNQLSDEKINMNLDGSSLLVNTEKADATFSCIPANEFPDLELSESGIKVTLKADVAAKAIQEVQFAAATDDSRPVLAGIYCRLNKDNLILACTDGYRMAEYKMDVSLDLKEEVKCIIPAKALSDIVKAFSAKAETIDLIINSESNIVTVKVEDMEAQLRMIDGEYPDYEAIIPDDFETEVRVARSELLNGIRLASVFAKDSGNSIKILAGEKGLEVKSQPSETGSNSTKLTGEIDGEDIEIAFNAKYLLDFLSNIEESEIIFKALDPLKPGLFKVSGQDNYFFLAMPMKANW